MKKSIIASVLVIMLIATCLFAFAACNDKVEESAEFEMPVGDRPDKASLISAEDQAIIDKGLAESAKDDDDESKDQDAIKAAVMALYTTANKSRIETPISLVVQESDAGISMGTVLMHAINIRNGEKWYYQLATEVQSSSSLINTIMNYAAGFLKVAYSDGEGNFYFYNGMGPQYECNCTVATFPYATFVIPEGEKVFDEPMTRDEFNLKLNVLSDSIHEINNMDFCAEIIADNATITYENGIYTVDFAVDTAPNDELVKNWYRKPQQDMQAGGQKIEKYNSYVAKLEMWDNGYAKYFESHADRKAGMASGKPVDKYSYIWDEQRILNLAKQDQAISFSDEKSILSIDDYIAFKLEMKIVEKKLGSLEIAGIVIGCVVAVVIAIVVTIEVLVKKGKLPKIAARREKAKQKRLEKKAAKQAKGVEAADNAHEEESGDNADEGESGDNADIDLGAVAQSDDDENKG